MLFVTVVMTALYLSAAWFALRHYIHMFQLNSYKPKVQIQWIKKNTKLWFNICMLWIGVFLLIYSLYSPALGKLGYVLWIATWATHLAAMTIPNLPKKSYKIPLKYTMRIKRLFSTLCIIYLLPIIALFITKREFTCMAVYLLMICLTPWLVLLANLINRPLELAINKWYINDAKRILRECPNLTVVGITGSFGKTSVKYFLDELLSVKFNVLKTPGNFNTPLGVVKTIRGELRATHDIFLCEMGAKNVGDIKEICDIVHPKHGIITSVGPMHLESFGSIENVKKTKFELADSLPEGGILALNMDDENVRECSKGRVFVGYGVDSREGYYCENLTISSTGSEFDVVSPSGERCRYKTKLIGRHNAINICGAVAMANQLGIELADLKPAVRRLESVPHRLELKQNGGVTIIDDAYNSNPSGAKAALETLAMMDGYKILCTPGMIELGEREDELNREFGRQAAVCDFVALVGKKQTAAIYEGLKAEGYPEERIYVADGLSDAMQKIYSLTTDGKKKIILLENDLPDNYGG